MSTGQGASCTAKPSMQSTGAATYVTHHPGYYMAATDLTYWNQWYTVSIAAGTLSLASGVVWYHRGSIAIRCKDAATFVGVQGFEQDAVVEHMSLL
jgi:hypothetical protein